jgi:hypothetical protein
MSNELQNSDQRHVGSSEWLADFEALNTPCDAPLRRARFERMERYNAFHDGLLSWVDSPEGQAALEKARSAALARMKARKVKSTNEKLTDPAK